MNPLEALHNIKHYDSRVGLHESDYQAIEVSLLAYKLIIEKRIDMDYLITCFGKQDGLKSYNNVCYYELTDLEYQFLKEALSI